jgi:hypothetical protein
VRVKWVERELKLFEDAERLDRLLGEAREHAGDVPPELLHRIAEIASHVAEHAATLATRERPVD